VLLQVEVTDTTPAEENDLNRIYQGDSVDLQLMTAGKSEGLVQVIAAPGRTAEQPQPRVKLFDYRSKDFKVGVPAVPPRVAVRKTARGYVLDMIVPWANLKITPQAGTIIGLRVGVADLAGQALTKAIFLNGETTTPWMDLPALRLSDQPGTPAASVATWGGYDEFAGTYVNVVAEADHAGQSVEVRDGDAVLASATLARDGQRATAALRFAAPPIGATYGPLAVRIAGAATATITLPDMQAQRLRAFLSGGDSPGRWGRVPAWLQLTCGGTVFTGDAFPTFDYPEPQRINALVASYSLSTAWFDAAGKRVSRPAAFGRYGAVTQVIDAAGDSFITYTTLYRAQQAPAADASAVLLAARQAAGSADDFLAAKLDRDWWHALRKTLHTEIRYEYAVHLPKGYDADLARRWPVIVYLHGSGGGNNPRDVRDGGPQKAAREKPDFPFITVSLRSPGGWYPPAVEDVLDEIAATCRTDPSRYYLTGFSMGGMGTWAVALDRPERFAAIAPVGGRAGDPTQAARLKKVAAWVINGGDDNTTTSADALQAVEALKAVGAEVKWTEIPGADHVESHLVAYGWDELYAWFLAHHR
jgi:predicted esterase